uniref:Uncharacterized protein n=1 Tax=Arundo donax TaxID=35708 RepID=A0A0A9G3E6_ARUDO
MMYPPGTVYAHPSTPPGMHPFSYPMPTNGNAETPGPAPNVPEMNGKSEPGRASGPSANGITSHSETEVRVTVKEVMPIPKMIHNQRKMTERKMAVLRMAYLIQHHREC